MRALPGHLERNLRDPCGVPPDARLLVAVSGGADSTALLHALAGVASRGRWELHVAHFNHGLRGLESDADADFVAASASGLGLPLHTARASGRRLTSPGRESVEMTARRLRHAFLARTAREIRADAVVLGHHADDQVELLLMRLLRGSGGSGLGGMRWSSASPADPEVRLCRPLLDVHRHDLRGWLATHGLTFREDASNSDPGIPRNAVRHQLLPFLREFAGAGLDPVLARVADLVGAESDYVAQTAAAWSASGSPADFVTLHPAVQRAVIRGQLWDLGQDATFELVERLRRRPARNTSASGARNWHRTKGTILPAATPTDDFQTGVRKVRLDGRVHQVTWHGVRLRWTPVNGPSAGQRPDPGAGCECFDAAAVGSRVELRHWRPGDRFQPLGLGRSAKLQDLFTNRKINASERRHRLLAATEAGEIFWVEGLPPGDRFRVTPTTRKRLDWSWVRD